MSSKMSWVLSSKKSSPSSPLLADAERDFRLVQPSMKSSRNNFTLMSKDEVRCHVCVG